MPPVRPSLALPASPDGLMDSTESGRDDPARLIPPHERGGIVIKRGLIGMALVSLLALDASATIFGTIHGTVRDDAHYAVAGARVTVRAEDSDWQKTAVTDGHGVYELKLLPLGRYEL